MRLFFILRNQTLYRVGFLIKALVIGVLFLSSTAIYGATIISTGVITLPNSEFTHVMIEIDQTVMHSMLILKNPNRIVLDLKSSPINNQLMALANKNFSDDLYIKQVRVGNFKAGVTRVVFDLKTEVKPKINIYKPLGKYQHRLMLDFYPIDTAQKTNQTSDVSTNISDKPNIDAADTSSSKSSGAKIILDPSFDEDEMSTDVYE